MKQNKKTILILLLHIIVFFVIFAAGLIFLLQTGFFESLLFPEKQVLETESEMEETPITAEALTETESETEITKLVCEEAVYSFMQGPVAWSTGVDWSGSWCEEDLAGSNFGSFGCGMCCIANLYGTFSPYDCSPLDIYYYAQEVSDYSPGGGIGAIDWPYMKTTLESMGFACELGQKEKSFEAFCKQIEQAEAAIVLVSSAYDDSYWPETEGHYVTIFLYDPEDQTVLLADSGNISHNRARIPLEYVYNALKESSSYQYLLVMDYNDADNTWKHDGIDEDWTAPKYYRKYKDE